MSNDCCVNLVFSASGRSGIERLHPSLWRSLRSAALTSAHDPAHRMGFGPRKAGEALGRSMAMVLRMPALSPTMEEGTVAKWLVKEGDDVKSGDILAEIETDKATMEFEAVDEGKIAKILVPEGSEGVKVGAPIAIMAGEGEDAGAAASAAPKADTPP